MDDDVKALLARTRTPARKERKERQEQPRRENRYVYNGPPPPHSGDEGPLLPRQNRKPLRRRISTFNTIMILFGGGILIVLYVHNIITINHLAAEVGQLQARYDAIQNTNASLRAEVNRKSAWERVGKTATEQLGLTFPTEQPQKVTIDRAALARAREQERPAGDDTGPTAR